MRASESDRGVACPASLVLPRFTQPSNDKRDRAAAWGTLAHHWKETGETDPEWADPRDVLLLEKKLLFSGVRREVYWPAPGEHEVTFAVELATAHSIRYSSGTLDRDAWKAAFPPTEWLTGTIDYLAPDELDDLKTGRWPVNPRTSKQLRSYALLPWIEAGCPIRWDLPVTITKWEKYPIPGLPTRDSHLLTGLDMAEHLADLRYSAAHPDEVNPTDEGCRFCACRPRCPAHIDEETQEDERELRSLLDY